MAKTYALKANRIEVYRGYTIKSVEFADLYYRTSGRSLRFQWCIIHPTQKGRMMNTSTLEGAMRIIDSIHAKVIAF